MEEYPANSNRDREAPEGRRKLQPVVTGKVIRKKPSLGSRVRSLLVSEDGSSVGHYILLDVLIPAMKETISDAVSQGIERMLFGESSMSGRRRSGYGYRSSGSSGYSGYTSYNRYSQGSASSALRRGEGRVTPPDRSQSRPTFETIVLATRREAEAVIDGMYHMIRQYNAASIADLCDLIDASSEYTDQKWGWTEDRGIDIRRVQDGYLLVFPPPVPIE